MKRFLINVIVVSLFVLSNLSCKKYLDQKPSSDLDIPNTWQDLQALLDNTSYFNMSSGTVMPELLSDNYYVTDSRWESFTADIRGAYIWNDLTSQEITTWVRPYQSVYQSNVVLDHLHRIKLNTPADIYNNIEGSALFYRSMAFFQLLQLYSKVYSSTAKTDLGIVLKLNASVTDYAVRSTVQQSYDQVINDLKQAEILLPKRSLNVMRPNSVAATALLARVFLSMSHYDQSRLHAEKAITLNGNLVDYNLLLPLSSPTIPDFLTNPEILFFSRSESHSFMGTSSIINPQLYNSYSNNDIRKKAFFTASSVGGAGTYRFKGSYYNISNSTIFNGLTSAEMYLILAECLIRAGSVKDGLDVLSTLLKKRYSPPFNSYTTSNQQEALDIVLDERRKELVYRNQRWTDIRRLNLEGRNIELHRYIKGSDYILPPNDLRSVLLVPNQEVERTGLIQNPR